MKTRMHMRGFLVIVAVVLILIFGFIGMIATYLVNTDVLEGVNDLGSTQALFIADSGLEAGVRAVLHPTIASRIACASVTGTTNLTNFTFSGASGPFTVTATGPQSPTVSTLNGALTASATSIVLLNASTYASSGRIRIDKENIDYEGISGNTLLNARRGVDGTTAVSHVTATPVAQYQCLLNATGGVPSLALTGNMMGGKRSVQEAIELPEAWVVGSKTGSAGNLTHWNKPTELQWSSANIAGLNKNLNAVTMISNADVWAVGNSGTIEHWTGSAWSASASGTGNNLFGVSCSAFNNCFAVGASRTFVLWNGASWTVQAVTVPNIQYNSVYCVASNDCWAVGNTSSGEVFVHWNGSNWTRDASLPAPAHNLNSVVCTSTSNCWAAGDSRTFVHWDGSTWTTQAVTVPNVTYNGIDCVASNDCWAVGNNSSGSVTVHWNGSSWTQNNSPSTSSNLFAVSCHGTNDCWATGASATTLHWDGSTWTNIANPAGNNLTGVSTIGALTSPTSAWQEVFP